MIYPAGGDLRIFGAIVQTRPEMKSGPSGCSAISAIGARAPCAQPRTRSSARRLVSWPVLAEREQRALWLARGLIIGRGAHFTLDHGWHVPGLRATHVRLRQQPAAARFSPQKTAPRAPEHGATCVISFGRLKRRLAPGSFCHRAAPTAAPMATRRFPRSPAHSAIVAEPAQVRGRGAQPGEGRISRAWRHERARLAPFTGFARCWALDKPTGQRPGKRITRGVSWLKLINEDRHRRRSAEACCPYSETHSLGVTRNALVLAHDGCGWQHRAQEVPAHARRARHVIATASVRLLNAISTTPMRIEVGRSAETSPCVGTGVWRAPGLGQLFKPLCWILASKSTETGRVGYAGRR